MDDVKRQRGVTIREEMFGKDYVSRTLLTAQGTAAAPFQDLVNEFCYGTVWDRDGLDRRSRSLVTIGLMAAGGQLEECGLHIAGALNGGAQEAEVVEVLLQVAIYCGLPRAREAFKVAEERFAARRHGSVA